MRAQELTLMDHVRTIGQLLAQCEEVEGNPLEKMRIVNEIFLYLSEYPRLVQDHTSFREVVQTKMNEFFASTRRYMDIADPEGGVVDEPLLNAATNLENSMNLLRQHM
jgi:hypothetical protein